MAIIKRWPLLRGLNNSHCMDNFICPRGQKNWLFLRGSHCGEVAVSGGLSVITCYSFHSFHLSLQINLTVNYASP